MRTFDTHYMNSKTGAAKTFRFPLSKLSQAAAWVVVATAIPNAVNAATFDVSTVAGLIAAINTANGNGQDDIINMAAGSYTLTAVNNNSNGPNGLPSITSRITINGASLTSAGVISTTIMRGGDVVPPAFRIFHIAAAGNLTLDRLVVRGGRSDSGGGIIVNGGRLTLNNSTVTDNDSDLGFSSGGGIANFDGVLTVFNSTVSNNTANFTGGGISNSGDGSLTVTRSTISGNSARRAGAIHNFNSMTMSNSTVSGNEGDLFSGGITNSGTASLNQVTITDNSLGGEGVNGAGGILNSAAATLNIRNSILAENSNLAGGAPDDCRGTLSSQGRNVVGTASGCTFVSAAGDQIGSDFDLADPELGALTNNNDGNGGTSTHALLVGSPAIDVVPNSGSSCLSTDQRERVRPADGNGNGVATCDAGAFERSAPPACGFRLVVLPGPVFRLDPVPATIFGSAGSNVIDGTAGADVIHGLGGNDTISGSGGNDRICGGPGNDILNGNLGNDSVFGEDGVDSLTGGSDDDSLSGGLGNDTLSGNPGDDSLSGGFGNDALNGGPDTDTCNGNEGNADTANANCETIINVP